MREAKRNYIFASSWISAMMYPHTNCCIDINVLKAHFFSLKGMSEWMMMMKSGGREENAANLFCPAKRSWSIIQNGRPPGQLANEIETVWRGSNISRGTILSRDVCVQRSETSCSSGRALQMYYWDLGLFYSFYISFTYHHHHHHSRLYLLLLLLSIFVAFDPLPSFLHSILLTVSSSTFSSFSYFSFFYYLQTTLITLLLLLLQLQLSLLLLRNTR